MAINWLEITKSPDKNHKILGQVLIDQKEKLEGLEAKNKEFERTIDDINKKNELMISDLKSKGNIIANFKDQLESSKNENQSLQSTIKNQEEKIKTLEEKVKEIIQLKAEIEQHKKELEQNQTIIKGCKDTETKIETELQQSKEIESELKSELEQHKDSELKMKSELQQYQDNQKELKSEIENLKGELSSIQEKLTDKEGENRISQLEGEIETCKQTIDEKKNEIDELINKLKDKNTEIDELTTKLEEKDTEIEEFKKDAEKTTGDLLSASESIIVPVIGKDSAINTLQNLLIEAKSSILLIAPSIRDVQDVPFKDLRSVIRVDMATKVEDKAIYDQLLETRPSMRIRDNPDIDRWGISIDGEKLFFAAGIEEPVGVITTNKQLIDFLAAILTESWVRAHKI